VRHWQSSTVLTCPVVQCAVTSQPCNIAPLLQSHSLDDVVALPLLQSHSLPDVVALPLLQSHSLPDVVPFAGIDVLRRAGAAVVVASVEQDLTVTCRYMRSQQLMQSCYLCWEWVSCRRMPALHLPH